MTARSSSRSLEWVQVAPGIFGIYVILFLSIYAFDSNRNAMGDQERQIVCSPLYRDWVSDWMSEHVNAGYVRLAFYPLCKAWSMRVKVGYVIDDQKFSP